MYRKSLIASASLGLAFLLAGASSMRAQAPSLGTAKTFAVLAGQSVTNSGPTVLSSDLGVSPGTAVSGFPPGILLPPGAQYVADAVAQQAQADLTAAYVDVAGRPCGAVLTGQDLGGLTLTTGVYCFASSAQLTGALTLDAQGDPNALFLFQIGSTLTTASNSVVTIINGGAGCNPNVYWQVGSSATLGTSTSFRGNLLAHTSITLNTGATVTGRVLARNGSVTLDTNHVLIPSACLCDTPASITTLGVGCGATLSSTLPVLGQVATIRVLSNLVNSKGLLLASANGAPRMLIQGCSSFLDFGTLSVPTGFTTNGVGNAQFSLAVPDTVLRCQDAFVFQAVVVSHGGPLSFGAASNGLRVTLGG
jgi:hypothetical protein